jgi:hypothetical protein
MRVKIARDGVEETGFSASGVCIGHCLGRGIG